MIIEDKNNAHDLYADLYSKYKISGTPFLSYRDIPDILTKYVKGNNVLDYGSGTGESTLFLKSLNYNVVAVDINDKMLSIARVRDPHGKYVKINNCNIPFARDINLIIYDYYWTEKDYREVFQKSGLSVLEVYHPLGKDNDGYDWKDEKFISPSSIIISKSLY